MARQYSLKAFLREAPNRLLEQYLTQQGVTLAVPWSGLGETSVEPIYGAIDAAEESAKLRVDCDLRQIHAMADEGGVKTIIEEGRHPKHNLDLADDIGALTGYVEQAFWAFINYPAVFRVASDLHSADNLPRWRKRLVLPAAAPPATDTETCRRLEGALSDFYSRTEGRGKAGHVDHYSRGERLYWFVYLEDYAVSQLGFDDHHELQMQMRRPAFEIVLVYNTEEHSLDTWLRGDKDTLEQVRRVFASVVMGIGGDLSDATGVVYDIQGLLSRDFPFPTELDDGVESVRVALLRLRVVGKGTKRITLEAGADSGDQGIHDLLDDVVSGGLPLARLRVQSAEVQLVFRPRPTGRGKRRLTVRVSHPDSCNLKDDETHLVAKALLKRWGIDVSGPSGAAAEKRGRSVQRSFRI